MLVNLTLENLMLAIIILLFMTFVIVVVILVQTLGKNDIMRDMFDSMSNMEKDILKDNNDSFIKILNQNENNYVRLSRDLQVALDKIREANEKKLALIENNINEKLDISLNERLDKSFKTIGEQLQHLQVTNGQLLSMSNSLTDLQKSLSSVKERGIFGEKQLENILDNLMTRSMYESQFRIKAGVDSMVDFAIKIPNKDDEGYVYLPIDAKFPNDRYIKIVDAANSHNEVLLNSAIKELREAILMQAKSISEKYIEVPITTEFAIMFLPTEGLYAECLRIENLAEICQSKYRVLLAGPTTISALINSFSVGFKYLQINKNSKEIAKVLQAVKAQYDKFTEEIEKTKKSLQAATISTDQLAKRNEMIVGKLKTFDTLDGNVADKLLEIS